MFTYLDSVYEEIRIWKQLDHPNICKLIQIIDDPSHNNIYLVMDFCEFGQIMLWED